MTRRPSPDRQSVRVSLLVSTFIGVTVTPVVAQTSIARFVVASGGGTSAAGPYSVSGTAGQLEAGTPLNGGPYSIAGGFWSIAGTEPCAFSIAPTNQSVAAIGASAIVTATASASTCAWTAVSHASWITITAGAAGTGQGDVRYTVVANISSQGRTGTLTIAGQTFTITQAGLTCAFSLAAASASLGSAVSTGNTVSVIANAGDCTWNAASNVDWITITAGRGGAGSGTVGYSLSALTSARTRNGTLSIAGGSFTVTQSAAVVAMSASRLNFGAVNDGAGTLMVQTPAQTLSLTQSGPGTVTWTAAADQPWITVTPASGSGPGTVTVSVTNAGAVLPAVGAVSGKVTITTTSGAANAPSADITLTVLAPATNTAAAGVFDTPTDGLGNVTGSIAVTGWAIDDIGVARVRITRAANMGNPTGDQIFIGEVVFVSGARPDIAAANPVVPYFERAGWGYLLLTNFLPNDGNGTFTLNAYADDVEGHSTLLGSKTITCTNATATEPFGAIDTPSQGGTVSGTAFVNFGWALTPNPKTIAADGSTIQVFIDSMPIGTVHSYNNPRPDIQTLFPGRANTDGAIGVRMIDTTTLANGVHTIAWIVIDNAGAAAGIGSRFFTVSNSNSESLVAGARPQAHHIDAAPQFMGTAADLGAARTSAAALLMRRGYDETTTSELLVPDGDGVRHVHVAQLDRIVVDLSWRGDDDEVRYQGFEQIGDQLRALPAGATLDTARGVFAWAPGLAFGGTRSLVFVRLCAHGNEHIKIDVTIVP